jgi:hypothetical protein
MFKLTDMNAKEIFSIEYHFEDENLNIEIREPLEIEVTDNGHHILTDSEGIFVISPKWVYISIIKRLSKEAKDTL